jgi:hypothetical protein
VLLQLGERCLRPYPTSRPITLQLRPGVGNDRGTLPTADALTPALSRALEDSLGEGVHIPGPQPPSRLWTLDSGLYDYSGTMTGTAAGINRTFSGVVPAKSPSISTGTGAAELIVTSVPVRYVTSRLRDRPLRRAVMA